MTTQGEMVPIDEIFHQGWELVQVSEIVTSYSPGVNQNDYNRQKV
jgi:hypothetical protein